MKTRKIYLKVIGVLMGLAGISTTTSCIKERTCECTYDGDDIFEVTIRDKCEEIDFDNNGDDIECEEK